MSDILWENDEPIAEQTDIDVPWWIEQDITPADIAAIIQGGCASGAYMPAVRYHQALATMNDYGDDILDQIEESGIGISGTDLVGTGSWAGMACHLVSMAVELWASSIEDELIDALEELETED